jgi:tRNA(Ile)-lysidine synthetase-like protein
MLARENPRVVEALLALAHEAQNGEAAAWRRDLPPELYLPTRSVQVVDRLVREGRGTRMVAVRNGEVAIGYGKVSWLPRKPGGLPRGKVDATAELGIPGPGRYRLLALPAPGLEIVPARTGRSPGGNFACFDVAKLKWPLCLRAPRPGDRMSPRGGRGSRKLSDLLIDAKISRQDRALLPVLCDATGAILCVPGLRPSELGRPDPNARVD